MIKYSKQRQRILEFLKSTKTHPAADEIYFSLKDEMPDLSLATVYRNLKVLSEAGEICRLDTGQNVDRYDGNTIKHDHFVCEKCDRVIDIGNEYVCDYNNLELGDGFYVKDHSLYLYGLCDNCGDI